MCIYIYIKIPHVQVVFPMLPYLWDENPPPETWTPGQAPRNGHAWSRDRALSPREQQGSAAGMGLTVAPLTIRNYRPYERMEKKNKKKKRKKDVEIVKCVCVCEAVLRMNRVFRCDNLSDFLGFLFGGIGKYVLRPWNSPSRFTSARAG